MTEVRGARQVLALDQLLEACAPWLPAGLVSPASLARHEIWAEECPVADGTHLLFEARLAGDDPGPTDVAFCANSAWPPEQTVPVGYPGLSHVFQLADWARSQARERAIPEIWVEFDEPSTAPGSAPVAWPCTYIDTRSWPLPQVRESLLETAAMLVRGAPLPASMLKTALFALDGLTESTPLRYVGFMRSREHDPVRLEVQTPGATAAIALCERLGWHGNRAALERLLGFAARFSPRHMLLAFDLVGEVRPRLGVELYTGGVFRPRADCLLGALVPALVTEGWCPEAKQAALAGWLGVKPVSLGESDDAWCCMASVNHIKLVLDEDGGIAAKAYLHARLVPEHSLPRSPRA